MHVTMTSVTSQPPFRVARAAIFTALCVGASGAGHAISSGHAVPVGGYALASPLVFALAYVGARGERGFSSILAWLAWIQLALHTMFSLTQALAGGAAHHHADAMSAHDSGWSMLLAHTVATLVAAWWIRWGESAAFALIEYARALFDRALLPTAPAPIPWRTTATVVPRASDPLPTLTFLRYTVSRRGPPCSPRRNATDLGRPSRAA